MMRRFLAFVLAGLLPLACAACGTGGRYFSMQGSNLADLQSDEIIRRIVEITGAADDEIMAPASNFGLHVNGDFDWQMDETISLIFPKRQGYYGCQLRIVPSDSQCFVTDTYRVTPSAPQYKLRNYLDALKYLPQEQIRGLAGMQPDLYSIDDVAGSGMPEDGQPCIFYDKNGITQRRDWQIRFDVLPMTRSEQEGSYEGIGADRMHLFYVDQEPSAVPGN
jgi:hypothetical protein